MPVHSVKLVSAARAAVSRAVACEISANKVTDGSESVGERGAAVSSGVVCNRSGEEEP